MSHGWRCDVGVGRERTAKSSGSNRSFIVAGYDYERISCLPQELSNKRPLQRGLRFLVLNIEVCQMQLHLLRRDLILQSGLQKGQCICYTRSVLDVETSNHNNPTKSSKDYWYGHNIVVCDQG